MTIKLWSKFLTHISRALLSDYRIKNNAFTQYVLKFTLIYLYDLTVSQKI